MGNCKGAPTARSQSDEVIKSRGRDIKLEADDCGEAQPSQQIQDDENIPHTKSLADVDALQKVREVLNHVGEHSGPAGEEIEWLNFAVKEIWPFVDKSVAKIIKDTVEPAIQAALPPGLRGTHFKGDISLGHAPPKLGPVNVTKKTFDKNQTGIELVIGLDWNCDAKFQLEVLPGVTIGIKRLNISGDVYLILRPLMDSVPIVGGIQITMVAPPTISWELTGIAQVVQFPTIASTLKGVVQQLLTDMLVLPNRVFVHWVWGREREIDISSMQYPRPEAVVRLGVVEARGLQGKDWNMFGKATSDPYARIQVGDRKHTTPVIKKTLEPKWGEDGWYDFLMYTPKQHLDIQLFDQDLAHFGAGDDTLGDLMVKDPQKEEPRKANLCDVLTAPDKWWTVYEKKGGGRNAQYEECGEIRICVEAFNLKPSPKLFDASRPDKPTKHGKAFADGLLSVQLRGLRGLPKQFAKNAKLRCTCTSPEMEPVIVESIKSQFHDTNEDHGTLDVDPVIQRMVEFLYIDGKPEKKICQVSGLTAEQVRCILDLRPSFHTKWNQSLHIPLVAPKEAEIHLRLVIPAESETAAPIELVGGPKRLSDFLPGLTKPEGVLCFEELVKMDRVQGLKGKIEGPFELDMKLQLFGLVPTDLQQLSAV